MSISGIACAVAPGQVKNFCTFYSFFLLVFLLSYAMIDYRKYH
nr:MAG TPA: hypothetical protein [Caudoviricetes sp.]